MKAARLETDSMIWVVPKVALAILGHLLQHNGKDVQCAEEPGLANFTTLPDEPVRLNERVFGIPARGVSANLTNCRKAHRRYTRYTTMSGGRSQSSQVTTSTNPGALNVRHDAGRQ